MSVSAPLDPKPSESLDFRVLFYSSAAACEDSSAEH